MHMKLYEDIISYTFGILYIYITQSGILVLPLKPYSHYAVFRSIL
jgi:hypothetical protein